MVMDHMIEMSSSPSTIDPYFDCGLGTGPTPTVVKNFKLPNSNINKDGPFLQIIEQPQTKFRFRYKSEMVGTHGQLKAESSDKNKTTFPTVKLCNWTGGPALVRLMLYTADENDNERKRHVHELSGKNCNKEGFTGGCEVVVEEKNNYTATFPNLGIIHIAKRDVQNIIFQRKKEQLVNYACMRNPGLRNEGIQHNIKPTDIKKLKEEAEEEAKTMDLNKVVLRFQAFFFNTKADCYRPITEYVDSDVIFNLKNASTGELKIVRISTVSAPCSGGSEIWMLVEKVKKSNVKIKFFELDQDGCEIWKGYGDFKESDVHHQYAIIFRTPPYRSSNIHEPVQVKIQLERPTDNDTSESIDFTYTPENLKRSNAFLEPKVESEFKPHKRIKHLPTEPIDLNTGHHLFLVSGDTNPYSPIHQKSPSQRVPSPIIPADSPSSQGFYSPPRHGLNSTPSIMVSANDDDYSLSPQRDENFSRSVNNQLINTEQIVNANPYHFTVNGDPSINGFLTMTEASCLIPHYQLEGGGVYTTQSAPVQSPPYQQVPSPDQSQPSPLVASPYEQDAYSPVFQVSYDTPVSAAVHQTNETPQEQIQQFDAYQKQVINSKSQMKHFDFSDLVKSPNQNNQNEDMDLLDIISNNTLFSASKAFGDIQADSVSTKEKSHKNSTTEKTAPVSSSNDVDALTKQLASVSVSDPNPNTKPAEGDRPKHLSYEQLLDRDIAFRVALKAAECLQMYAAIGDTSLLLAAHRYLLGVQNNQGDNSLHTAISNKNLEAFNKIMKAALEVYCCDYLLNVQNIAGETPLHLAVKEQHPIMIQHLISAPQCKTNILDSEGNTPLHVAAAQANHLCLSILLTQPDSKASGAVAKIINSHNFHGKTPLHLAVNSGSLNKVKLLLQAGADVHICEMKRGANSLHLAAMFHHVPIAEYLVNNTNMTVDAGMFDGNTALHVAAQGGNKDICAILLKAKANPYARNSIRKSAAKVAAAADSEEEEEEDQEAKTSSDASDDAASVEEAEEEFYTPFDYAGDNEEILSILRGEVNLTSSKDPPATVAAPTSPSHSESKIMTSSGTLDSGIDISSSDVTC